MAETRAERLKAASERCNTAWSWTNFKGGGVVELDGDFNMAELKAVLAELEQLAAAEQLEKEAGW